MWKKRSINKKKYTNNGSKVSPPPNSVKLEVKISNESAEPYQIILNQSFYSIFVYILSTTFIYTCQSPKEKLESNPHSSGLFNKSLILQNRPNPNFGKITSVQAHVSLDVLRNWTNFPWLKVNDHFWEVGF